MCVNLWLMVIVTAGDRIRANSLRTTRSDKTPVTLGR